MVHCDVLLQTGSGLGTRFKGEYAAVPLQESRQSQRIIAEIGSNVANYCTGREKALNVIGVPSIALTGPKETRLHII